MRGWVLTLMFPIVMLALGPPAPLEAQRGGVWLQGGAGEARWSTAAAEAGRLRFGMLGARGTLDPRGPFAFEARLGGGRGDDAVGRAAWWSGEGGPSFTAWAGPFRLSAAATGWAVHYEQDLSYTAYGARLLGAAEWRRGPWQLRARGEGVGGGWRQSHVERRGPPVQVPAPVLPGEDVEVVTRDDLALAGFGLDAIRFAGPLWLRATPLAYRAQGRVTEAWQHAVEGELGTRLGPVAAAAGVRWVSLVPEEDAERTGNVGVQARARLDLGATWSLLAQVDSRPWDPLHAVSRGAAAQVALEWRVLPRGPSGPAVVELGPWAEAGRTVRFRFRHPTAGRVDLVGDFTGWRPHAMTRNQSVWETAMVLPPGIHHFAFLLDSEAWVVPDHAPGIVEDGWQRKNATVVVAERPR